MMAHSLKLEDFGAPGPAPGGNGETGGHPLPADLETLRLDAYEAGYRSGWDDCAAAESEAQRRIGADLARNLSDMRFSYHEARADVLASLEPLFGGILERLLPAIVAEGIVPAVAAELSAAAERAAELSCEILAAPAVCPALEKLLEAQGATDLRLVPEPAFAEGQVSLRFASETRDIDLGAAAEQISRAMTEFVAELSSRPEAQGKGAA